MTKVPLFMELPELQRIVGMVDLLKKTIYGLKQSPREWYQLLESTLQSLGFKRSESDRCVFHHPVLAIYILAYVDDLLITASKDEAITKTKAELAKFFKVTDNGPVSRFLGIDVIQTAEGISLSQLFYIKGIIARFGMENSRPASTPYDPNVMSRQRVSCLSDASAW